MEAATVRKCKVPFRSFPCSMKWGSRRPAAVAGKVHEFQISKSGGTASEMDWRVGSFSYALLESRPPEHVVQNLEATRVLLPGTD